MLTTIKILSALLGVGGVIWLAVLLWSSLPMDDEYGRQNKEVKKKPFKAFIVPILMTVIGLFVFIILVSGAAAQVPATHIGVVENTWTGQFFTLEPGTHIWPFSPRLVPFVTKVTKYDLRRQIIEIGAQPLQEKGVQADSNSPGRPAVYFWARGWAYPNKATIIELHRRYGSTYLDDWVERVWVSSLKGIQGGRAYDFVGNYRVEFQDLVEQGLQDQLVSENGDSLVFVSQLAIVDYGFDKAIEDLLGTVATKEFERQVAEQQILINQKAQEAATIQAQTNYIITKRAAEAEQAKLIAEATGRAEATELEADAAAYSIKVKYQAESAGIRLIQTALAESPEAYLEYLRAKQWDGKLPIYMFGSVPLPFITVPNIPE